jgi:hypothetical protein
MWAGVHVWYVNNIIMDENHKPKRLWSFIKSKRTDWCVVAPLRRDGIAYEWCDVGGFPFFWYFTLVD